MLVLPFQNLNGWKKAAGLSLYHGSRILVYATIGFIMHSFRGLFNPHWQQIVSVIIGSLLLLAGIISFYKKGRGGFQLPWAAALQRGAARFIAAPGWTSLAAAGLLNGLLPCGLVYMALSSVMLAGTGIAAAGAMATFGLGTLPMLLTITLLKNTALRPMLRPLRNAVPVLMLVFGALFLVRGMNLGIPYLSPSVSVTAHGAVKASCCHKQ